MSGIVIGMDPHKVSVTIEVRDEREVLLGTGRFGTDTGGYKAMLGYCRQWPRRTWAVEGANGTGRPTAQRLLADGERVLDVPAKLAARARVFDTGHARETDAHDAHAIVMVALRTQGLRELTVDEGLAVLRLLADRRDELSRSRAQILNRLQRLLVELVPGGAKRELSSFKARDLLATVWPRDLPGRTAASSPSTWWGGLRALASNSESRSSGSAAAARARTRWASSASARPARPASWPTSAMSPASPTGRTSRHGPAPPDRRLVW
jgi:transposase